MADALRQRFNDDLLLEKEDRRLARERFSRHLFSVLYFKDLCKFFKKHDDAANRPKRKLRSAGVGAIVAGVLALLAASAAPLVHLKIDEPGPARIRALASLLGITSVVIGLFGGVGSKKKLANLAPQSAHDRATAPISIADAGLPNSKRSRRDGGLRTRRKIHS